MCLSMGGCVHLLAIVNCAVDIVCMYAPNMGDSDLGAYLGTCRVRVGLSDSVFQTP